MRLPWAKLDFLKNHRLAAQAKVPIGMPLLVFVGLSGLAVWMAVGHIAIRNTGTVLFLRLAAALWVAVLIFQCRRWRAEWQEQSRRVEKLLASEAAVVLSNSELHKRMADAMRTQQRLFEHREAIFAVNAAVYQASSFQESLQIIAELAPGVLDVDLCLVTLAASDDDLSTVAAVTRPYGDDLVGKTFQRKGTNSEIVRATRRMLVIEDAKSHPGTHPVLGERLNAGSVVYLPLLQTDGPSMGMLTLVRHAAGPFQPEQLNLAEMFTARAAAAVENAQLLDQTRRDANAKTMLLRELNHRVKNNLASIITLLSLDEPELSAAARQWLRRAIDRIRTMARTHDLFAGGIERVSLVELVQQMIPSLSVVKPPEVEIRTELAGADVLLRTDRAVSLAMVLHELCSNAIIHGTGASGAVTIRAVLRPAEAQLTGANSVKRAGNVALEVIDQGRPHLSESQVVRDLVLSGAALNERAAGMESGADLNLPDGDSETRTPRLGAGGLGLILVDGLVTRELGGTFSRTRLSGGGSSALVRFPVGGDEIGEGGFRR